MHELSSKFQVSLHFKDVKLYALFFLLSFVEKNFIAMEIKEAVARI